MKSTVLYLLQLSIIILPFSAAASSPAPLQFSPGTSQEAALLLKNNGSTVINNNRQAPAGSFWVYALPVVPGAKCSLTVNTASLPGAAMPLITPLDATKLPLPCSTTASGSQETITWTVPDYWHFGSPERVMFSAHSATASVSSFILTVQDMQTQGVSQAQLNWMQQHSHVHATVLASHPSLPDLQSLPPGIQLLPRSGAVLLPPAAAPAAVPLKTLGWSVLQQQVVSPAAQPAPANVDGVVLVQQGYPASAGRSQAFQQAWQTKYGQPWQQSSVSAQMREQTGRLMAALTLQRTVDALLNLQKNSPNVQRILQMSDPLTAMRTGSILPFWHIASSPLVQQIIAGPSASLSQLNAAYRGGLQQEPFSQLMLAYTAAAGALQGLPAKLVLKVPAAANQFMWQNAVTAALLAPHSDDYLLNSPPPGSGLHTVWRNIMAALPKIPAGSPAARNLAIHTAVLLSDTAQWRSAGSVPPDANALYALTLPLLKRGVPVQLASLERMVDPAVLNGYNTLLLSFDNQRPLALPTLQALADWMRNGGSLLVFGGPGETKGWWNKQGASTPLAALLQQAGISFSPADPVQRMLPDTAVYQTTLQAPVNGALRNLTSSLTAFNKQGGVCLRFSSSAPQSGQQAVLHELILRINGNIAAAFVPGSRIENRFVIYNQQSVLGPEGRFVTGNGSWVYQFNHLPLNASIALQVNADGPLLIQAAPALQKSIYDLHAASSLANLSQRFPAIHTGIAYRVYPSPQNSLPQGAQTLFRLNNGAAAVWELNVGRGMFIYTGISPAWFASGARSGSLLRALARLATQHAGGVWHEPGYMLASRGPLIAIHTFGEPANVSERTADLFSPTLQVAQNRVIPPHTSALFLRAGPPDAPPHLILTNGSLLATLQTSRHTAFLVQSQPNAPCLALLQTGGKTLTGIRAVNRYGIQVPLQTTPEGSALLVQFNGDTDGIAVRAGWK